MSGYLSFTHEQWDWVMSMSGELSKREYSILMVIIRYTHGFNRNEARLSGSYINAACGIRATHVPETLRKLQVRGIIELLPKERNTNVVSFSWKQILPTPPNSGESTPPNSGESTPPNSGGYPSQNGRVTPPKTGVKPSQNGREEKKEENKETNKEEKEAEGNTDHGGPINSDALF